MLFTCPICGGRFLAPSDGRLACKLGHSFDRSRDGYYNFLLSASSGTHGDDREMLRARRAFLDTGAYFPLAEAISKILTERMPRGGALLDAGCGEGYYTNIFERALTARDGSSCVAGLDVSKDAVRLAAKRSSETELAVASVYKIPSEDGAFDAAVSIFSPLAREELLRVLKRGGIFIMAIPDKRHLFGLKKILYEHPYENKPEGTELSGFRLLSEERIAYPLVLDSQDKISGLFRMTPYAYRTPPEAKARLAALTSLECEAEFIVLCYEKL